VTVPADHPLTWAVGDASSLAACRDHAGTWGELVAWATAEPERSGESMADYAALPKGEQGALKRASWIVGGPVAGGHRMATAVRERHLLTVDIDEATPAALAHLEMQTGFPRGWAYCGHTTRSSTPDAPRIRLYLPLPHPLPPDEYRAAALGLCAMLEEASVDEAGEQHVTTDRAASCDLARLMYGPTLCADAPHVAIVCEGGFPDVAVLVAAGREEAAREGAATPAAPTPRSGATAPAWADSDDVDRHGLTAMRAAGAVIVQSPRRRDELTTNCPWHDDAHPSLDIHADGRMVCRAGCKPGGQPITWLRYVCAVTGCTEAEAFRLARRAAGLPDRTPLAPGDPGFDDLDRAPAEAAPRSRFGWTALADLPLLDVRPEDRLWGDILTRGCVTILAGQAGVGKSTLVRHLVAHLATGRNFLGREIGRPITVAVVDFETPDVFRRVFWGEVFGEEIGAVRSVVTATVTPSLTPEVVASLIGETAGTDLVVVDTVSAAFTIENENDNAQMEAVARLLRAVAKSGPAVLAIAHPSKAGADVRGASALQGAVETIVTFRAVTQLGDSGPDEATEFSLAVKKNRVGQMGAEMVRWDGEGGFVAPDAMTDAELAHSEAVVLDAVKKRRPGTISQSDVLSIAALDRVSNRAAKWALRRLLLSGRIQRKARGQYG
jgi:hypothetical protein